MAKTIKGIQTANEFSLRKKEYLDDRQSFDTIADMAGFDDVPDGFITLNKENGKRYEYNSSNTIDTDLGKWREYKSGGSISFDDWKEDTYYKEDTLVVKNTTLYICAIAHTSTQDFDNDLAGGNWNVYVGGSGMEHKVVTQALYDQLLKDNKIEDDIIYIVKDSDDSADFALKEDVYQKHTVTVYEVCQPTDIGALEVVADGTSPLTDTQIEESNVTPIKEGQTINVGDYVILVESQKTNVTKFVPRNELDTVPTKDSENRLTSGSVYSSLYETKQRTVIDTPENYVVCTSTDTGALEVVADDTTPTATQVTLSVVQAFVHTAQVGEYYQHIDEVSHLEDYESSIYAPRDEVYDKTDIDEKVQDINDAINNIISGGYEPMSVAEFTNFYDGLVITSTQI